MDTFDWPVAAVEHVPAVHDSESGADVAHRYGHVHRAVGDLDRGLAASYAQPVAAEELDLQLRVLRPGVHQQRPLTSQERPLRWGGAPVRRLRLPERPARVRQTCR